jgi:glyoxylase-like metal-dependent hydrolase (beta-lactamase superfamily II)
VLIDGGAGKALPTSGRLPAVLAGLGVQPDSIDAVLATHLHFDHVGGLVDNGRATFPNAEVYAPRADVAYFTDPAQAAAAPDFNKGHFAVTAALVAATPRLQRFDGERAITPFISSVDLAGHTPGHTGFRIADGGETLLIVADALFDPAVHPQNAEIGIAFEADPAAATLMRQRLYARAAEERALLAATHMPFPGFGRIVADGTSRRWVPADWEYAT